MWQISIRVLFQAELFKKRHEIKLGWHVFLSHTYFNHLPRRRENLKGFLRHRKPRNTGGFCSFTKKKFGTKKIDKNFVKFREIYQN